MIFYYIHQDIGASNKLKKMKYSMMHLNHCRNSKEDVKIHLDYLRHLGRNPQHDLASFKKFRFVDSIDVSSFDNQFSINNGFPFNEHIKYIEYSLKQDDQCIYIDGDMFFHDIIYFNKDSFVFWKTEGTWINVPWGFPEQKDAEKFFSFCQNEGLANGTYKDYEIFSCQLLHIPKKYLQDFHDKVPKMLKYLIDMYTDKLNENVLCSLASSICISIVANDIIRRDKVSFDTYFYKNSSLTRYTSEVESDISGSLKLFFE